MSANAILDASAALRDRLKTALNRYDPTATVFVGPLDDADASSASLVLFLYRIVPNPSLRNREHSVVSSTATPPVVVFRNSLPLDLYFLLTVGTTAGDSEERLLSALGFAMQEIQSEPELIIKDQTVRVTPEPLTTEDASRIWALFPTANYRTSVAYLATPVWIDPLAETPLAARVTTDQVSAGNKVQEVTREPAL
jgi:hypothetical protein